MAFRSQGTMGGCTSRIIHCRSIRNLGIGKVRISIRLESGTTQSSDRKKMPRQTVSCIPGLQSPSMQDLDPPVSEVAQEMPA